MGGQNKFRETKFREKNPARKYSVGLLPGKKSGETNPGKKIRGKKSGEKIRGKIWGNKHEGEKNPGQKSREKIWY